MRHESREKKNGKKEVIIYEIGKFPEADSRNFSDRKYKKREDY